MRKPTEGLEELRKTEIMDACAFLYESKGYHEISIRDISAVTSFSRPTIYNYFQTKEEIFLALLTGEYRKWTEDVGRLLEAEKPLSVELLAAELADTLERRWMLLKISAMNLYEIEEHSSLESLKEYKLAFGEAMEAVCRCISRSVPGSEEEIRQSIQYEFFPFTYGVYPFVCPTDKQRRAMTEVGISFAPITIREITERFLRKMIRGSAELPPQIRKDGN